MSSENTLRTLKDFTRSQYSEGQDKKGNPIKYFDERELKAEAVNHLKNIEKKENLPYVLRGLTKEHQIILKTYILWNNNLIEEDLK